MFELKVHDILTKRILFIFLSIVLFILFSTTNFDNNLNQYNNLLIHRKLLRDNVLEPYEAKSITTTISSSTLSSLLMEIKQQNDLILKQNKQIIELSLDYKQNKDSKQLDQITSTSISHDSLNTMKEIGANSGTDKVLHHSYDRYYPIFLENLRMKPINMLEIGFLHGNSYKMWIEYFPNGIILSKPKNKHFISIIFIIFYSLYNYF
jgi:hypothetical protein